EIDELLAALDDRSPPVAQAAHIALSRMTGADVELSPWEGRAAREAGGRAWRERLSATSRDAIEEELIGRLGQKGRAAILRAIEALGRVGGPRGARALRDVWPSLRGTDLRLELALIRAIGSIGDPASIELLARILDGSIDEARSPQAAIGSHEFGFTQAPVQRAAAAAEALGLIGGRDAEEHLLASFARLDEFWRYTFQNGDHEWLEGSHASLVHFRIIEALDRIESRRTALIAPALIRSLPMDPDRGLLFENDTYEVLVASLVARSGRGDAAIEASFAALEGAATLSVDGGAGGLLEAVTESPPAVSVGKLSPRARAAHILSVLVIETRHAARIRRALERTMRDPALATDPREKAWVGFLLARALGKLGDRASSPLLIDILENGTPELDVGIPAPPSVFLHTVMTPLVRAAAADALGRIGSRDATPALLRAVEVYTNAMDVRHAAASSLFRLADPSAAAELARIAEGYPEVLTGRMLVRASRRCGGVARP
ncbi:MAG TPA: HEAT repeat domain-containing protein, partial [Planctomycetota bacterium]|nr:HEAT repeat domain-containing protein [Planctomycetota bacterium]